MGVTVLYVEGEVGAEEVQEELVLRGLQQQEGERPRSGSAVCVVRKATTGRIVPVTNTEQYYYVIRLLLSVQF